VPPPTQPGFSYADSGQVCRRFVEPFTDLQQPADNAITARRAIRVTATPGGEDGWHGWTERSVIDCALRRGGPDDSGWRVASYEIRQAGLR
jgi:hypothetical protein